MTRIEHDSLGPVEIPEGRYWGAQTQRAVEHFAIVDNPERWRWGRAVIAALGQVKKAAAGVNDELGLLPDGVADLIAAAADEVIAGTLDDHFPLLIWQSGSGTQTNMNANEVIANRAIELAGGEIGSKDPVHPNDHVNRSQSSNDVIPTVMHLAAVAELRGRLYPAVEQLVGTLRRLAAEHAELVKVGRTHLQDAAPVTLGQEIGSWATQLEAALGLVRRAEEWLRHDLAIGGTATGTGLNSPASFGPRMAERLSHALGVDLAPATDHLAATASHDALVATSAALRTLASAALKMGNDVRWLASGPRAGIGELILPANEPGSSIMPGKANPTQVEMVAMVAAQVIGNDAAVAFAGTQGSFQLNTYKPLITRNVLDSVELLAGALASFDRHCAQGIEPDRARIADHLDRNLMLATALNPHIGYDAAAQVVKRAAADDTSVREAGVAMGAFTAADYDRWVDPRTLTRPDTDPD